MNEKTTKRQYRFFQNIKDLKNLIKLIFRFNRSKNLKKYFHFLFHHYNYPSDSQDSNKGIRHRASNYPDLLLEKPRYCCPVVVDVVEISVVVF